MITSLPPGLKMRGSVSSRDSSLALYLCIALIRPVWIGAVGLTGKRSGGGAGGKDDVVGE